ncbi:MAG TPA: polysaccharide deacetylase family protein [Mucilaginibacter sp.]|jgi:peptidoglycan/xylan/chitin deacetylase (PgdA/CDA1 family)
MKDRVFNKIKNLFAHKAIVLMYHRIAEPKSDIWEIAVSPERFEEHLQVLRKMGNVVSLGQLANSISTEHFPGNNIAITFDDGYADNFTTARPLLEKYGIPATFFIASGNIENKREFWWDELELIILSAQSLPEVFSLNIKGNQILCELKNESFLSDEIRQQHNTWKACTETPPTARAKLFYELWQQLKPLPYPEQQRYLQIIRNWAKLPLTTRPGYRTMSAAEINQLASNNLFTIGAHTITHPALACHDVNIQKDELNENKGRLREITNREINLLAYPYGNYNEETLRVASELGFYAAFTTEEKTLRLKSPMRSLGRFQVKNITGAELRDEIKLWRLQ